MSSLSEVNKAAATRFIHAFNTNDWNTVREVVHPDFALTHPVPGRVQLGPEGMIKVWSHFKAALPDSWHPIPIMITDGSYLANLLPTYGTFNGEPHQGTPPTGKWLEYGMVNIVQIKDGKLAEAWFGMDPVAEAQQMGAAPTPPPRKLSEFEQANIELFQKTINTEGLEFDNLTAFSNVVVAARPPQHDKDTNARRIDVYHAAGGKLEPVYSHEFRTDPPYPGDPAVDTEVSRAVVKRFFEHVLTGHDLEALGAITSPHILIHPTAMPCEVSSYGTKGASEWLGAQWQSFPDLRVTDTIVVASGDIVAVHWKATGTSKGGFQMLPPTGNPVEYTGSSMYRVENGRIAEIWETRNTLGIMRQLNPEMGRGHH